MSWCCISSKNVEVPVKKLPEAAGVSVDVKVAQKPVMLKFRLPSDEDSLTVVASNAVVQKEEQKEQKVRTPSYYSIFRGLAMVIGIYSLAYLVASASPTSPASPSPPTSPVSNWAEPVFLTAYA